jgi:hypothetical protein
MMEGEVLPLRNCHHDKKESKRKREDTASNKFDKFLVEICDIPEDENEGEFGALYGERYDGKNSNNIEEELLTSEIFGYFTSYLRRENAYSYAKNMLSQIRTFFKEKYPMIVEPGHPLGEIPYKTLAKNISDHYVTDSRVKRKPIIEHKLPVREIDNNQLCKMYFVNGDHQMRAMQSLDWVCLGRISELSGLQWRDLLVHRVPTLLVYENCLYIPSRIVLLFKDCFANWYTQNLFAIDVHGGMNLIAIITKYCPK